MKVVKLNWRVKVMDAKSNWKVKVNSNQTVKEKARKKEEDIMPKFTNIFVILISPFMEVE